MKLLAVLAVTGQGFRDIEIQNEVTLIYTLSCCINWLSKAVLLKGEFLSYVLVEDVSLCSVQAKYSKTSREC